MSFVEYWLNTSEKEGKGTSVTLRAGMGFILGGKKAKKILRLAPEFAIPTRLSKCGGSLFPD
jgi:hypothetical protein